MPSALAQVTISSRETGELLSAVPTVSSADAVAADRASFTPPVRGRPIADFDPLPTDIFCVPGIDWPPACAPLIGCPLRRAQALRPHRGERALRLVGAVDRRTARHGANAAAFRSIYHRTVGRRFIPGLAVALVISGDAIYGICGMLSWRRAAVHYRRRACRLRFNSWRNAEQRFGESSARRYAPIDISLKHGGVAYRCLNYLPRAAD